MLDGTGAVPKFVPRYQFPTPPDSSADPNDYIASRELQDGLWCREGGEPPRPQESADFLPWYAISAHHCSPHSSHGSFVHLREELPFRFLMLFQQLRSGAFEAAGSMELPVRRTCRLSLQMVAGETSFPSSWSILVVVYGMSREDVFTPRSISIFRR
jgi:hypothetical protein